MRRPRSFSLLAGLAGLAAFAVAAWLNGAPAAHADNYEARWSTRPVVGVALLEEEGATRDELGIAGGASLSVAYGITNQLDLGAELVALSTLMPTFDAAIMSNGYIARGDFQRRSATTLLLLGPSWRFGALGWTPVISAGFGGGVRLRSRGSFPRTGLIPDDKVELAALEKPCMRSRQPRSPRARRPRPVRAKPPGIWGRRPASQTGR
jgi:hypothetical protein